jgi:hypothetical protein
MTTTDDPAIANAIFAATGSADNPATHFIRLPGTVPGAYKFEYAPNGVASGLCVSDPGGGWATDPQARSGPLAQQAEGPTDVGPGSAGLMALVTWDQL